MENTKSTSCIAYVTPVSTLQAELDHLFDFDGNGIIDVYDKGHISVRREGDGTTRWSFGYEYTFESMGSSLRLGSSSVLGSNAPQLHILGIGSSIRCLDVPGTEQVSKLNATVFHGDTTILNVFTNENNIRAGTKIKVGRSTNQDKIYIVNNTFLNEIAI